MLAASANASTITTSFTTPLAVTNFQTTNNLDFFNTTLGTLTGAKIFYSTANMFTVVGTNLSDSVQTASYDMQTQITFASALSGLNSFLPGATVKNFSTGQQVYAANQTITAGPIGGAEGGSQDLASLLGSLQWNGTTGPDTFAVSCDAVSGASGTGRSVMYSGTAEAQCAVSVVYTYDAVATSVPEPGSFALFGIALCGIGFTMKRRES